MNEVTIGILGLAIILVLFLTGIELGFAMILVGFLGFGYLVSWQAALNLLAKDFFDVLIATGILSYRSSFLWARWPSTRVLRKGCLILPTNSSAISRVGSPWQQ